MKRALLIGINYIGTENELHGCVNDINIISEHLKNDFGFAENNIKFLTDEPSLIDSKKSTVLKPTRANIEDNIKWLVDGSKNGDLLFFYYSGHGSSLPDKNGDESDGKDEVLIPVDFQTKGYILDDWMFDNLIKLVPKGCRLYSFTDCCHSSTIMDVSSVCKYIPELANSGKCSKNYTSSEWKNSISVSTEKRAYPEGTIIHFSGCLDAQTSADASFNNTAQGAMSKCLNDTICSRINLIKNKKTSVFDILKEVNCRLVIEHFEQRSTVSLSPNVKITEPFYPL